MKLYRTLLRVVADHDDTVWVVVPANGLRGVYKLPFSIFPDRSRRLAGLDYRFYGHTNLQAGDELVIEGPYEFPEVDR